MYVGEISVPVNLSRSQPDPKHYVGGCGCPRCDYVNAVAAFTKDYTGHNSNKNTAFVLAEAARLIYEMKD